MLCFPFINKSTLKDKTLFINLLGYNYNVKKNTINVTLLNSI